MNRLYTNTKDKKRVGNLLGTLLRKHGTDSVSFDDLLTWDLWPSFVGIYGKLCMACCILYNSQNVLIISDLLLYTANESLISTEDGTAAQSCLPEDCYEMCVRAHSTLELVCRNIIEGDITVNELQKISAKMDQMKRLCRAASVSENQEPQQQQFAFKGIKAALEQRMDEYKAFTRRKEHLGTLCSAIDVNIKGWNQCFIDNAYSYINIVTLCNQVLRT